MKVVVNGYRFGYHVDPIFQNDLDKYIGGVAAEDLDSSIDPDDERLVRFVEHILTLKKMLKKERCSGTNYLEFRCDKTYRIGMEDFSGHYLFEVYEFPLEIVELPEETTDYAILRKIFLDHNGEYEGDCEYVVYCADGEIFFHYPSNIE